MPPRSERRSPRAERMQALLDAGDHGGARAEARGLLRDLDAPDRDRAAARAVLAALAPDRGVVAAGVAGIAVALAIAARVLLRG
jgi:hypothetical protein